jgi:hypothetical protein
MAHRRHSSLGGWAEHNFDFHLLHFLVRNLDNLIKTLLPNAGCRLLKQLALPLDHRPAHRPLSTGVTFHALFRRHGKEKHHTRNLMLAREIQQILARGRRERCGVNHA